MISPPRLVALDLDGTLLRTDRTVSARTRSVLTTLVEQGVHVVPATARQERGVRMLADQVDFTGWAVLSNGAVVSHLTTGEVITEATISPEDLQGLVAAVVSAIPGTVFFCVRDGGTTSYCEAGYRELAHFEDHKRDPTTFSVCSLADLVSRRANKIAFRHPTLAVEHLFALTRELDLPEVTVSDSGAPFVDVTAAGVTKAYGLAALAEHLGIEPAEVIAFGDADNDASMLRWSGHAVAMPTAPPAVRDLADETAPSNDDDGVARVLERVFAL